LSRSFKSFTVSTDKTVKSMIEHVRRQNKPDDKELAEWCKGWVATEVLERGNGMWYKVSHWCCSF
jgi:hypothetical protein